MKTTHHEQEKESHVILWHKLRRECGTRCKMLTNRIKTEKLPQLWQTDRGLHGRDSITEIDQVELSGEGRALWTAVARYCPIWGNLKECQRIGYELEAQSLASRERLGFYLNCKLWLMCFCMVGYFNKVPNGLKLLHSFLSKEESRTQALQWVLDVTDISPQQQKTASCGCMAVWRCHEWSWEHSGNEGDSEDKYIAAQRYLYAAHI